MFKEITKLAYLGSTQKLQVLIDSSKIKEIVQCKDFCMIDLGNALIYSPMKLNELQEVLNA